MSAPGTECPDEGRRRAEPQAFPTMAPTSDVAAGADAASLPGAHRGGFARALTEPVPVAAPVVREDAPAWQPAEPVHPARGIAVWALTAAILGLVLSFFIGWGFPVGIVGIITAIAALRRPLESRLIAWWAIALAALSLLYSAGWLAWAAMHTTTIG